MAYIAREPHRRSKLHARIRARRVKSSRFNLLIIAIRKAMIEHLASPSDLQQAARFVAEEMAWYHYRVTQVPAKSKPGKVVTADDAPEEDDDDEDGEVTS